MKRYWAYLRTSGAGLGLERAADRRRVNVRRLEREAK